LVILFEEFLKNVSISLPKSVLISFTIFLISVLISMVDGFKVENFTLLI